MAIKAMNLCFTSNIPKLEINDLKNKYRLFAKMNLPVPYYHDLLKLKHLMQDAKQAHDKHLNDHDNDVLPIINFKS